MSDAVFDAGWLGLREPVDHRSRASALTEALAAAGEARGWHRVADLGGGAGSNLRYLAPRLPWAREWTVVDHDAGLLDRIEAPSGAALARVHADLDSPAGLGVVDRVDAVTASALLDLVSRGWLRRLVARCAPRGAGVLLTLSYDGTSRWDPADPDDARVLEAVNRHQRRDKGLGAALGPDAGAVAAELLTEAGYRVRTAPSPWVLQAPGDGALVRTLVEGWVEAAIETTPGEAERLRAWGERRLAGWSDGDVALTVGHLDVLGLPPDLP